MPNRIIREAILSSERIASLGWPEEVFYRRLMSIVDDYGRTEANPQLLRSKCYPLQTDSVRAADVTRWMAACQNAGTILCYEANGKQYLEVRNFGQQQRSPSKCPPPPAADINCAQVPATAHLGVSVSGVVSEVGGEARASTGRTRKNKVSMPDGFGVSERVKAWAKAKGYGHLDEHLEAFVLKVGANGYTYADWDDAFMGAIRADWANVRGRTKNGAAAPPDGAEPEWHESQSGVEAKGIELGLGPWVQTEQFPAYKSRVLKAHQQGAH